MPSAPLELLAELVILCNVEVNIPFEEDVPRMDVLLITLLSDLRNKFGRVIGLLRSGGSCFSFPRGHLHEKNHKKQS